LTQKPADYSIGSVLRLTEDGLAPVSCLDNGVSDCPRRDTCHTLPMWRKLDDMINGFLDSVTLADLMESPENQNFDEG
jgi:DNA-binding IscR family transcriptional regulator